MTEDPADKSAAPRTLRGDDLTPAVDALGDLCQRAKARVLGHVTEAGRISSRLLDRHQLAALHLKGYVAHRHRRAVAQFHGLDVEQHIRRVGIGRGHAVTSAGFA